MAQIHMGLTLSFRQGRQQAFLIHLTNVRKILSKRTHCRFKAYRNFNVYGKGFFAFQGGLDEETFGDLIAGWISYLHCYDPAIHLIRCLINVMSLAAFCLCGHLRDVSSVTLRDARSQVLDAFHALKQYVKYLKGGKKIRVELVNCFTEWTQVFDENFPLTNASSHDFLEALYEQLFHKQAWSKQQEYRKSALENYVSVIENAVHHSHSLSGLEVMRVYFAEILSKFFVFGDSRDTLYNVLKCAYGIRHFRPLSYSRRKTRTGLLKT